MSKITVYGTKTCPYCIKLKAWLDKQSIDYISYDIDQNPIAAQSMASLADEMIVPFTTIEQADGQLEKVIGFEPDKIKSILKK